MTTLAYSDALSKAQAMADAVAEEHDRDRIFFRRHPHRSYRIRRGSRVEAETVEVLAGSPDLFGGRAVFVAVWQVKPGLRLRSYFTAPADTETDLSEADAERIFGLVADPRLIPISLAEAQEVGR